MAQEGFQGLSQTRLLLWISFLHGCLSEPDNVGHHQVSDSEVAFKCGTAGNPGVCLWLACRIVFN